MPDVTNHRKFYFYRMPLESWVKPIRYLIIFKINPQFFSNRMKFLRSFQCFSNFNHQFSTSKSIFWKIYDTNEIMLQWRQVWIVDRSIISSISYCVTSRINFDKGRLKAYPIYTIIDNESKGKSDKKLNACNKTTAKSSKK